MGKQTLSVLIAFVAIHVAVVLMAISIATPEWLEGTATVNSTWHNTTAGKNSSGNHTAGNHSVPYNYTKVTKGLWEICFDGDCHGIYSYDINQSGWFKACVVLAVLGALGTFVTTCLYYVFVLVARFRQNARFFFLLLAVQLVAVVEFSATIVIFALRNREQVDNPLMAGEDVDLSLAWSFYVGLAGAVFAWIAAAGSMREACLINSDRAPYENI